MDMLDLGNGQAAPKGTPLYVAAADRLTTDGTDPAFVGTLYSVTYLDGVPFTVTLWDGDRFRHVYADRVTTDIPRRYRRKANEMEGARA
jgi:hypothetical protein